MKTTFEQFIAANPTCGKFKDNADARRIFNIISWRENILKMMDMSEFGKPALAGCVKEIEEFCDSDNNKSIDLRDDFTRKMIGRMVKSVLEPYGYRVDKQKDIPQKACSKYFSTASCYVATEDSENFRMVINDDIMEVRKGNTLFSNFHLEYVIRFYERDGQTKYVSINGRHYDLHTKYPFKSQGNVHLIFLSEYGIWFGLSFDGQDSEMIVNSNPIIKQLIKKLNVDWEIDENYGFEVDDDTIFRIIKDSQEDMEFKIKIREVYNGGGEFSFCGVSKNEHEIRLHPYVDYAFYIGEDDLECFLYYFLTKYFDAYMPKNYQTAEEQCNKHEFDHWGCNYFTVPQILEMLDEITASAEMLRTDYDKAIQQDFAKNFSIFFMTDDDESQHYMPHDVAIKKHIGNVIDFYHRFVARMKKLIESKPDIEHIIITGP
ncbi:MAG: hypothetical protein K2M89_01590 [Clostridiales bacterium]|nr:hypothetical protein [Clostridiales bacterium]